MRRSALQNVKIEEKSNLIQSANLNAASVDRNIRFNGRRKVGARKFLLFRFSALYNRNCEFVFVDFGIEFEYLVDLFFRVLLLLMRRMAFLPEELARSNERRRLFELPTLQSERRRSEAILEEEKRLTTTLHH